MYTPDFYYAINFYVVKETCTYCAVNSYITSKVICTCVVKNNISTLFHQITQVQGSFLTVYSTLNIGSLKAHVLDNIKYSFTFIITQRNAYLATGFF